MKYLFIIFYCYITFAWGINHTQKVLSDDVLSQSWEWGRNTLICSYWYELYQPSETLNWYKRNINQPIVYVSGDKAATPNYLAHYKIDGLKQAPADSFYVWCIYPNKLNASGYNITRVNPELSWQNIFFVTRKR